MSSISIFDTFHVRDQYLCVYDTLSMYLYLTQHWMGLSIDNNIETGFTYQWRRPVYYILGISYASLIKLRRKSVWNFNAWTEWIRNRSNQPMRGSYLGTRPRLDPERRPWGRRGSSRTSNLGRRSFWIALKSNQREKNSITVYFPRRSDLF